jgi:hypothetical protein
MEPLTPTTPLPPIATSDSQNETTTIDTSTPAATTLNQEVHHTKNLYPFVRHTLLVICVLFSLLLILFLMHQNGKSIYDNGI